MENVLCEALADGTLMMDSADNIATQTSCFDCRGMGEPVNQKARHHFGTHPATLNKYAADPPLEGHMQRLQKEI